MRPSGILATIPTILPTRRSIFLWGQPGIGKSTFVADVARSMGLQLLDVRAVLLDPVDLRGLPAADSGRQYVDWLLPKFLPHDPGSAGILFLDELPQAPPMVQSACLQLALDHRIGDYELPEGWSVIAAGNRHTDRAGSHRLISSLANRFIHFTVDLSVDDWLTWALGAGIAPEIRSFIRHRPTMLNTFDPTDSAQSVFATPRGWHCAADVFRSVPLEYLLETLQGIVGQAPAAEFVGFLEVCDQLPNLDGVFTNPDSEHVPTEASVLFAMCGAIVERARSANKAKLGAMMRYLVRMPQEFQVVLVRDALAVNRGIQQAAGFSDWINSNKHLLA